VAATLPVATPSAANRWSCRGAVGVGTSLGPPGLHRQHRRGPVQRLDLGLRTHGQHDRVLRRNHVQADHVGDLPDQLGIGGDLERLDPPRLHPVVTPRPGPGRIADLRRRASSRLDQCVTPSAPGDAVVIETPRWDPTSFKVHFGLVTLKGYTKGEHVLRVRGDRVQHKAIGVGRVLDKFPVIVARLAGMTERFCTMLDGVDVGFIPDGALDQLPSPSRIGATRVGGVDPNKPRISPGHGRRARPHRRTRRVHRRRPGREMCTPSPGTPTTPSARPPTTCASSEASTSLSHPATAGATTRHLRLLAPWPPCSPCVPR
jgi:hypothetical protein